MKQLKSCVITTPITIGVGTLAVIVFLIAKLPWNYYLIGLFTGLLSNGVLIKFNRIIAANLEKDPECKSYKPTTTLTLGRIIRTALVIFVILGVVFKTDLPNNKDGLWDVMFTIFGYLTYRIVFIICILVFKDKEMVISE